MTLTPTWEGQPSRDRVCHPGTHLPHTRQSLRNTPGMSESSYMSGF